MHEKGKNSNRIKQNIKIIIIYYEIKQNLLKKGKNNNKKENIV